MSWDAEQDQRNVDAGRARWIECPGPGHQKCTHGGRYLNYAKPPRQGGWYRDLGACFGCRKDRASHGRKVRAGAARGRAKVARLAIAPPCSVCQGPLWPEGSAPARVRSDKVTCSDRCRQAKKRGN